MMKQIFREALHFVVLVLISLAIVIPIRQFVIQPFLVRGDSMIPNFANFDYLFVERVSYYARDPKRGEIIVFRFPRGREDFFIKRLIGLPGERVIIEEGNVFIAQAGGEKVELDESYLLPSAFTQGNIDVTLGDEEYYVLGDNRGASFDSRRWGSLPANDIVGRVLIRVWPVSNARAFWGEEYELSM